jgi:hypothetical protein
MDDILGYPCENLTQSGYKPNMSYKYLIIVLYFSYTLKTKYRNPMIFTFFFLALLAIENPSKSVIFNFQSFKISC